MTETDIKKLIFMTKAVYPSAFAKYTAYDLENMLAAWQMCLEEYSYEEAAQGLKAYMVTDKKGFPPAVGQIIEQIHNIRPKDEPIGAMEAWSLVYKAICNSSYNSEKEFENLPPLCQKVIGNPYTLKEMASMDSSTVKSVEQSHFIRQYNEYAKREQELSRLPDSMRLESQERMAIGVNE